MKRNILLALSLAALPAACASPDTRYYRLTAIPGSVATPAMSVPRTIEVRRPSIAAYLDRSEIVTASDPYRLHVSGLDRWAAPLDALIARTLVDDLGQRLPGRIVITDAAGLGVVSDAVIETDIQQLDTERGSNGQAVLRAQFSVRSGSSPLRTQTIRIAEPNPASDPEHAVAAFSGLMGQLADRMAALVNVPEDPGEADRLAGRGRSGRAEEKDRSAPD